MSVLLCSRCQRRFHEGDHIMARVVSIYHDVPIPHGETYQYCIERPHAATNIQHLCCPED